MSDVRNVIILGAGCAGWTSAIYTARANLEPLLLTGMEPGGQLGLTTDVENYPGFPEGILGPELMDRLEKQARRFGTEVKYEWVTSVDFSDRPLKITTTGGHYAAHAVIIATGSSPRKLDIPGETELWGFGVSACATCDGALYKGKIVTVVGGGDTAAEEATFLTRFADRVYLIHRRDRLRASAIMAQRVLENPRIKVLWNTLVDECVGRKPDGLTGVRLRNSVTGELTELPTDGFFLAIGHQPATGFLQGAVELDEAGYVVTDRFQRTNVTGVFAAGDVQDRTWQQAVTAAGTGCAAALAAEKYLEALEGSVYPDERRMEIAERSLTPES